ncbi:msl4211 [Mesorhizobium japonicum MAFF 303099]|uniref:Msl4211 protein n=1 Tax=Mesorhizobium japonicum (strain LMG 29417 / CECT 9101 / MAFF 303099) TaxID=266835 RepID=Q98EJ7_RHILO|nr:msl4211 [Mesorhizobium japonicum MAFF 303099]
MPFCPVSFYLDAVHRPACHRLEVKYVSVFRQKPIVYLAKFPIAQDLVRRTVSLKPEGKKFVGLIFELHGLSDWLRGNIFPRHTI